MLYACKSVKFGEKIVQETDIWPIASCRINVFCCTQLEPNCALKDCMHTTIESTWKTHLDLDKNVLMKTREENIDHTWIQKLLQKPPHRQEPDKTATTISRRASHKKNHACSQLLCETRQLIITATPSGSRQQRNLNSSPWTQVCDQYLPLFLILPTVKSQD